MKIEPEQLIGLLNAAAGHKADTGGGAGFADHLTGKRVLVRTRTSGVSVGVLRAAATSEAGYSVILDDGIRVWSWRGALACSTLSTEGPETVKGERHPDGIVIADDGLELHPVTDTAWEKFQTFTTS